jgi:hypothetical protein
MALLYSELREYSSSSTSTLFSNPDEYDYYDASNPTTASASFTPPAAASAAVHSQSAAGAAGNTSYPSLRSLAEHRIDGVAELNRLRLLGATHQEMTSAADTISKSRPECCQTFRELPC